MNTLCIFSGLMAESQCMTCVGGMACDLEGLVNPRVACSAGYFCRSGANMTTPMLGKIFYASIHRVTFKADISHHQVR